MNRLTKKFVAIATVLVVSVCLIPGAAHGITASELQAQIDLLLAQLKTLQDQLVTLEGTTPTTGGAITGIPSDFTFTTNLKLGSVGNDVKYLQIVLNSDTATKLAETGAGSPGNETTYFGPITKAAAIKFQEKYASEVLTPIGLTAGTGFVGSMTIAKLNTLLTAEGTVPEIPEGCECTTWTNDVCGTDANAGKMHQTRTCTPTACAVESQYVTDATCSVVSTTGLKMELAADNPVAIAVAKGAYDKVFAKIKFTAGTDSAKTITSIKIHRSGLADSDDISEVKIYDGTTQLGSTQALDTVTYKAGFSNLSWQIPAGTSKVLTVKATIDGTNGTAGNQPKLGIAAAADVVTSETVNVEGAPIYGNAMTIAGIVVGSFSVDANTSPAAGDVISGATDQFVASFKFGANASEGFDVQEIVLTEVGTSVDGDIKNITLKYLGETLATVASLTDGKATFTGSPIFTVKAGTSKDIYVYVDVSSGVISERTIKFEITEAANVTAVGKNTGGIVLITKTYGTYSTYTVQQSASQTIKQGTLTVALDAATNPSDTYYVIGSSQNPIVSFKFSAGSSEGIKITKLRLTKDTTGDEVEDTEFGSVQLYIDSATASTGHIGSISSGVITFSDTNGLFTVPKSGNAIVTVKADINTAATNAELIGFGIDAITDVEMKGVDSNEKIYSDATHITLSSVATTNLGQHTVKGYGDLVVSTASDTPAGVNISKGQTGIEIFKFKLAAAYEDILVSSIKVGFFNDAALVAGDDTEATSTGYIANVKLYDGTTLLKEVSTPAAGYVDFSINLTVLKNDSKTLSVKLDVPTGSNLLYLAGTIAEPGDDYATIADQLTSTGVSSAQTITETGSARGNVFTAQAPTLTIAAAATPPAQQIVSNTSNAWLGRMQMKANYEDIKITKVFVSFDDGSGLNSASAASTNFSNVRIKNGSTQFGTTAQITDAADSGSGRDMAKFEGIEGFTINKDQTISLDIYADVIGSDTAWYVGIASSTDVAGSGVSSNVSVNSDTETARVSQATTLRSSGTLTVSVDADTPVATNIAVGNSGKTGVVFNKLKFEALYEDMIVKRLNLTLTDSGDVASANATTTAGNYDFDKVYLYDGTTLLATAPALTATVEFYNDAGLFTVPNSEVKVITVKANLFGLTTGAYSGDSPLFYVANLQDTDMVQAQGVSSNASTTATDGTPNPETYSLFNAQWLYKTIVTVDKNAASPSGGATAAASAEVLRFDVTADSAADAVLNTVAITLSGTADVSTAATAKAALYKSTDLTTALAEETSKYITVEGGSAAFATTTATGGSDSLGFRGIPVGATVHIRDIDTPEWFTAKVATVGTETNGIHRITFSSSISEALTNGDIIYYQPLQPGSGKLFFGAMNYLALDTAYGDTSITVDSTDGFAAGDTVMFTGYKSDGTATTTATALTVATTTATVIHFTAAFNHAIDYNYHVTSATDAKLYKAYVYTDAAADNVEEAIAAGTTKTFVVKGDTTGSASTKTIRADIAAIADLKWDDKNQAIINTLTKNLPITGGTLTY